MTVKIQQIGNSHMITLPKPLLDILGWKSGDYIEPIPEKNEVRLVPKNKSMHKRHKLTDIIDNIELKNFDFEASLKLVKDETYQR